MKIWLITGASRGLGAAFARAALESGDCVVGTSRCADDVTKAVGLHERLLAPTLDVTNPQDSVEAVDAALKRFGRLDVLITNAGYGVAGALEECSTEETLDQFQTNVFDLLEVTKAVLPAMRAQRSGHIVNIGSVGDFFASDGVSAYCAT
jgi:NAD(P)-dependent dehydrogenase (short-subunit alcohol dehydrogenase family)